MFNEYLDLLAKKDLKIIDLFVDSIGIKDNDELLLDIDNAKVYFQNLFKKEITILSALKEDSHLIIYLLIDKVKYVQKVTMKEKINKIVTTLESEYKRIRLDIAYNGSNYYGFQKQSLKPSIQDALERALFKITKSEIKVTGASRTDAKVHAIKQVVHFDVNIDLPCEKWVSLLNYFLPKDIRVLMAYNVSPLFHSRFDVIKKEYKYFLSLDEIDPFRVNFVNYTNINDFDLFVKESKSFIGEHDFYSFSKGEKEDTVRTIYNFDIKRNEKEIEITIVGDGFLHNMIRLMIGALLDIANNRQNMTIDEIIKRKDKNLTKRIALAEGLYLANIYY